MDGIVISLLEQGFHFLLAWWKQSLMKSYKVGGGQLKPRRKTGRKVALLSEWISVD